MSPAAARIAPLRQQLADYDELLAAQRSNWRRGELGRLRRGREKVAEILRDLAGLLIAGGWHG